MWILFIAMAGWMVYLTGRIESLVLSHVSDPLSQKYKSVQQSDSGVRVSMSGHDKYAAVLVEPVGIGLTALYNIKVMRKGSGSFVKLEGCERLSSIVACDYVDRISAGVLNTETIEGGTEVMLTD